jgi:hypothetical protein
MLENIISTIFYSTAGVPAASLGAAVCSVNGQSVPCDSLAPIMGGSFLVVFLVLFILYIVSFWKIFTKAGQPGWASIIPIYNMVVLLKVVGRPVWWIILFFVPFVNFIVAIIVTNDMSKAFGKSVGFTVGLILLPFIFYPILGLGKAQYGVSGVVDYGVTQ